MKKVFNNQFVNQKINSFVRVIANNLNVSKVVCDHLIDEKHTNGHRMIVGIFIMSVGVSVSKIHVAYTIMHFLLDGVGYAIHGIGLIPFVDTLSKHAHDEHQEPDKKDENKPE